MVCPQFGCSFFPQCPECWSQDQVCWSVLGARNQCSVSASTHSGWFGFCINKTLTTTINHVTRHLVDCATGFSAKSWSCLRNVHIKCDTVGFIGLRAVTALFYLFWRFKSLFTLVFCRKLTGYGFLVNYLTRTCRKYSNEM